MKNIKDWPWKKIMTVIATIASFLGGLFTGKL